MVLLFLGYAFLFLFSPLCFCCPKIVTVTIHFGRWSDQIGYIPCEGMSYFPPNNSYFVDVSLAFRIKGKLHGWELFLKDKTEVQLREFYSWLFSKSVWKNGHVKKQK
ncbi:unnamed protein product [Pipistrellus nathusii]|uniref:Secreted protein n=1 Tax=Pipistrellus nathusii TaxID=59473 RepID=A0ABN9Z9H2_PIPNA